VVIRAAAIAVVLAGCELVVSVPQGQLGAADHCTADPQCATPTPFCDTIREICVECATNPDCPADRPACLGGVCRGCIGDADCGTVCLADGTCADPSRVVYASPTGTGTDCTQPSPCDLDTATAHVTATTDVVKLAPGLYARSASLVLATTATLAGTTATLMASATPALEIDAGDVTVIGLGIAGNGQTGIVCQGGAKLRLHRAQITGAAAGVSATCDVTITRSSIAGNSGYGVVVTTGPVAIASSFITNNGGGVSLSSVVSGTIYDATIANNTGATGLTCTSSSVAIENDIVTGNAIDPACVASYCDLDAGYTGTGTNNVTVDAMFVMPGVDYHLLPGSPVRGLGDPAVPVVEDYDGEVRPRPAATPPDLGADEID
jgi:hypothetical protein